MGECESGSENKKSELLACLPVGRLWLTLSLLLLSHQVSNLNSSDPEEYENITFLS
jgi:hypothetical protein